VNADAQVERILRERAARLARPRAADAPADAMELLEFRLAGERYAVETRFVNEVHPLRDLTPLPGTPAFIRGIVNLRGKILPVYDLKKFFQLPEHGVTDLHRIVVVNGGDFEIGLLADVITGVTTLPRAALSPPLPTLSAIAAEFLEGVTAERLTGHAEIGAHPLELLGAPLELLVELGARRLELGVRLGQLVGAAAVLVDQLGVRDGDAHLIGEREQRRELGLHPARAYAAGAARLEVEHADRRAIGAAHAGDRHAGDRVDRQRVDARRLAEARVGARVVRDDRLAAGAR
jgi:purine-binding chemotaxis protein CheW